MTKGMGAPSFVISLMRMMPAVWSNLMAVAHTLPYDAALLAGYMDGKPLPAGLWTIVTMPTLVLEGTERARLHCVMLPKHWRAFSLTRNY
jgi:hypothetical protein